MILFLTAILGLLAGSLASALADRLVDGRNWLSARSTCDSCQKKLTFKDLVPIFSWLAFSGHCRHCQKPIGKHYPLIELLGAGLFLLFYWQTPLAWQGVEALWLLAWGPILAIFLILLLADWRHLILPTGAIIVLFWLVLGIGLIEAGLGSDPAGQVLTIGLNLWAGGGLFWLIYQISPRLIGFGDVRLGAVLGLIIGSWWLTFLAISLAAWLGILTYLPFFKKSKKVSQQKIPFGPSLIIASLIIILWPISFDQLFIF